MEQIKKILEKKEKMAIGLMSGTSMDGIDTALVKIEGFCETTKIELLDYRNYEFPAGLSDFLKAGISNEIIKLSDVSQLNVLIGELFADSANKIITSNRLKSSDIDFIGSHGQTIWHHPEKQEYFGKVINSTLQLGNISIIAGKTGILTIGNFRMGDIAAGGEGAPLIPYFDYTMFKSEIENIAVLNIGGISNVTILPAGCKIDDVSAFDCGPGNILTDNLMKILFNKNLDKNGEIAKRGKISQILLEELKNLNFFEKPPPKSTGREYFGDKLIKRILETSAKLNLSKEDIIATASELTPYGIFINIKKNLDFGINKFIISGGGVHNSFFLERLAHYMPESQIYISDDFGIDKDAKESIAFAFFANEVLNNQRISLRKSTGVEKSVLCGEIALQNLQ